MQFPGRIFDLYYGAPGSGKSEAIRELIEAFIKQNPDSLARVVIGDGSIATYDNLITRGKVEAVEFSHRKFPIEVAEKLTSGWFPIDNPLGELVPPGDQPNFSRTGLVIFEGASVMASHIMSNIDGGLADLAGKGHKFGQDSPFQIPQGEVDKNGKFLKDGRNYGGNAMSHFGIGQRHITDAVQRSKGLSPYVIWTAHEYTNDPEKDQIIKEMTVGPEVIGKKLTTTFQRMFGSTLHFQTVATRKKVTDTHTKKDRQELDLDYRIWTRDHFSPDQNTLIRYKAVTRGVKTLDDYYNSITEYYDALREAQIREGGLDTAV